MFLNSFFPKVTNHGRFLKTKLFYFKAAKSSIDPIFIIYPVQKFFCSANESSLRTPQKSPSLNSTTDAFPSAITSIKDILNADPTSKMAVRAQGWVRSVRQMKKNTFLDLYDGSSYNDLQIIIPTSLYPQTATFGSGLEVHGYIQPSKSSGQSLEMVATKIDVIGACDDVKYPIKTRQNHSMDYLRTQQHLRVRTKTFSSITRCRNAAFFSAHQFFQDRDFQHIQTPILTTNDCEGAGEVFTVHSLNPNTSCEERTNLNNIKDNNNNNKDNNNNSINNNNINDNSIINIDNDINNNNTNNSNNNNNNNNINSYFGQPVYLTVSGQLHLEVMTGAFTKVYTFGPTFRAENNYSRHHLCEFAMLEAEVTCIGITVRNITELIEDLIKSMTTSMMKRCYQDVQRLINNNTHQLDFIEKVINSVYHRITYTDAVDILSKSNQSFASSVHWGIDLNKEMEKYLSEKVFNHVPVFITDFPAKYTLKDKAKPFYMRMNEDGLTVASVDLLMSGVGEVCGGGLRESNVDVLKENIRVMRADETCNREGDNVDYNINPSLFLNQSINTNSTVSNSSKSLSSLSRPTSSLSSSTIPPSTIPPSTIPQSNIHSSTISSSTPSSTDPLDWYTDLRRFGGLPHGGFGLGFERYLQALLKLQVIRDALPFPRAAHHCKM